MAEETVPTSGNMLVKGAAKVAQAEGKGALIKSKAATKVAEHLSSGIAKTVQRRNKEFNEIMDTQLSKEGLSDEEWQKLYKRFKKRRAAYVYLNKKERMDFERDTIKEASEKQKNDTDKEEIAEIITDKDNEIDVKDIDDSTIQDIVTGDIEPTKDDKGRVGYSLNSDALKEFVIRDEQGNNRLESYKGAWDDDRFTISKDGKHKTDKFGNKYTNDKTGFQEFQRNAKLYWIQKARETGDKMLHYNSTTGKREYLDPDEAEALLNDKKKFVTMDEIKDHVRGAAKDSNTSTALNSNIISGAEKAKNLKVGDNINFDREEAKSRYNKLVNDTDPYKLANKKYIGNTSWKQDMTEKLQSMEYGELGVDDKTVKELDPTNDGKISESDAKSIVNKIEDDEEMLKGYLTDYFTIYEEREFKNNIPSNLKTDQAPSTVEVNGGTINDDGEWTPD